jgi:FkbM family methyltransferase
MRSASASWRAAIAWRMWYYQTQLGKGVLQRCGLFPRVFATYRDAAAYVRVLLTLKPNAAPVSLRLKELDGRAVFCRPGTSDPWVLWDTFYYKYQLPPVEIPANGSIVDLGANVGYTAAHLASCYKTARILAVEMDEANAQIAAQNLASFGPRCELIRAAIWSEDGWVSYGGNEEQGFRISVGTPPVGSARLSPAKSLDRLFDEFRLTSVDYVKMDIEGAEAAVLGSSLAWTRRVRAMKIELHKPATIAECSRILTREGFDCRKDRCHPHCLVAIRPGAGK